MSQTFNITAAPLWKKNLYTLTIAQFFIRVGHTFINPYLVLFIKNDLHVSNLKLAAFWAGLSAGAIFIGQFFMSPLWGFLADKYGPKLMVLRTTISISIFMFLTSMVNNVFELFILRLIMGCFSGFNASAILLIAYETPDNKLGSSMGIYQTGQTSGLIIGPVLGGLLAHFFGYRLSFVIASIMNLLVFFFVLFYVKESKELKDTLLNKNHSNLDKKSFRETFNIILQSKFFLLMYIFIFITQVSLREIEPQIALFVSDIYRGAHLELTVALVFTITACADIFFAPLTGKISDKVGSLKVLLWCTRIAGIIIILHIFANNIYIFMIMRFLYGSAIAGILPSINALFGKNAPKGIKGAVFGLTASITGLGNFSGPFFGGLIIAILGLHNGFICIFLLTGLLFIMNNLLINKVLKYKKSNQ
jgi:DHA1 family multidrug resistance protein-like MFS transporter